MKTKNEVKLSTNVKGGVERNSPTPSGIMFDVQPGELNSIQARTLELLLHAGFKFVTFERYARYPAVEREEFVALLDVSGGSVKLFGQVGYRVGDGIGMLVEKEQGKAFVWKGQSVTATSELLAAYERIKLDLRGLLHGLTGEAP